MTETTDPRAELMEHAQRLHDTHYALATSNLDVAYSRGRQYCERWDVYDFSRAALIGVLRRLVPDNSEERAWRVYELMLDDSGEGVEWWLRAEAEETGYIERCFYTCEQALRPDGQPFECALPRDHHGVHEAPDGEGCTVLWHDES